MTGVLMHMCAKARMSMRTHVSHVNIPSVDSIVHEFTLKSTFYFPPLEPRYVAMSLWMAQFWTYKVSIRQHGFHVVIRREAPAATPHSSPHLLPSPSPLAHLLVFSPSGSSRVQMAQQF